MAKNLSSSVESKNTWLEESKMVAKVQNLLSYREIILSEKTEAVLSGKPKALGLAFHGCIYSNFRAPAQA